MLADLFQPTKYHEQLARLRVQKFNPYHGKDGLFASKDKATSVSAGGPASTLAAYHSTSKTAGEILDDVLSGADKRRYLEATTEANQLYASGRSSKKENTKPGTNSYTAKRLTLHREIMAKMLGQHDAHRPEPGEKPKLTLLGGRTGSGKGNFETGIGQDVMSVYDRSKAAVIDPDVIKGMLPGYDPKHASLFHDEANDIFNKVVSQGKKEGLNMVLDFTMSSDKRSLVKGFKKAGYAVEAHYVFRQPEKAAVAAIQRWQQPTKVLQLDGSYKKWPHGRIVPVQIVLDQTKNEKYFDQIRGSVDRWSLYDNSRSEFDPRLVDSSDGRHLTQKINLYHDALGRFTSKLKAMFGKGSRTTEKWTHERPQDGRVLNGVALQIDDAPDFSKSVNRRMKEPPLVPVPGKHVASGVVVVEPDGRVWVVQPKNFYGGYKNTFPKGTVKDGEDLQETAAREVWEESGLVVAITGHLVDVERGYSKTRFYVGKRIGGAPWMAGRESHAVKLLPLRGKSADRQLENVFGQKTTDQKVLDALRARVKKFEYVLKANRYHDKEGQFTTKEKAVPPGWYKSQGGHHVEVGPGGVIVGGSHAGKLAEAKRFAAGPFQTHAEAKAHALVPASIPASMPASIVSAKPGSVDLAGRSKKIEALLKSGVAPKHAILNATVSAEANALRVKAIGSGPALGRALTEYSQTPGQDLDVLTGIEVRTEAVGGQAYCTFDRKVVMGSTSVTGDFRHELGHAIHMSLSPSLQSHVEKLHTEAMAKVAKQPAGLEKKLSHEFYEETYGVIGRRSLDNWHEDFAEHYRAYQKAVHQVKAAKDANALHKYTQRHPKWSAFWDAYYAGGSS